MVSIPLFIFGLDVFTIEMDCSPILWTTDYLLSLVEYCYGEILISWSKDYNYMRTVLSYNLDCNTVWWVCILSVGEGTALWRFIWWRSRNWCGSSHFFVWLFRLLIFNFLCCFLYVITILYIYIVTCIRLLLYVLYVFSTKAAFFHFNGSLLLSMSVMNKDVICGLWNSYNC